jgi:hypothetical protein
MAEGIAPIAIPEIARIGGNPPNLLGQRLALLPEALAQLGIDGSTGLGQR